jgi:hypothetical protein
MAWMSDLFWVAWVGAILNGLDVRPVLGGLDVGAILNGLDVRPVLGGLDVGAILNGLDVRPVLGGLDVQTGLDVQIGRTRESNASWDNFGGLDVKALR